jgi:exodeoxyribonuclease-3
MSAPPEKAPPPETLKIISVTANSLQRSWPKGLKAYAESTSPDILCIQATAVTAETQNSFHLRGYRGYFFYPTSQSGTPLGSAVYTKFEPISARIGLEDPAGRVIVVEFTKFIVVSVLAPSAGPDLEGLREKVDDWFPKFIGLVKELQAVKPVVVAGNFNLADRDIDIYDAAENESDPGFTADERGSFDSFLADGYVDVFREKNPDLQEFTYFAQRVGRKARGRGRRYDYFVVARGSLAAVVETSIDSAPRFGDHVPIVLLVNRAYALSEEDKVVETTSITVLNSGEVIELPEEDPAKKKSPKRRITPDDMKAILLETRTSEREKKPVKREGFDESDEKVPRRVRVSFDEEEYGRPARRKKGKKAN